MGRGGMDCIKFGKLNEKVLRCDYKVLRENQDQYPVTH